MKRKNLKKISLTLAAAAVFAALGGATLTPSVSAAAAPAKKTIAEVFSVSKAEISPETVGTKKVTAFNVSDDGTVTLKRNLALKWFEDENDVKYFNMKFALKSLDFDTFTISMDATSAWATEDDKATNTVTFKNNAGAYTVKINDGAEKPITLVAGEEMTFALEQGTVDGEFNVKLNGVVCDDPFVNIGANYASYTYNKKSPLQFSFDFGETNVATKEAKLLVYEINGQKFDNVLENDAVEDTAAPVLVVNEELDGFLLGTQFSLDYTTIDVLQDSNLSKSLEWYQYNPNIASTDTEKFEKFSTLTTSTYFYDTVYKVGDTYTTVFEEMDAEFVSIKIQVWDSTFNAAEGEYAKKTYDLAWYVNPTKVNKALSTTLLYIPVNQNDDGPAYKTLDKTSQQFADYQALLVKAAEDVYAGSNAYVNLPSLKWFIDDNNGYRDMKFTISYRVPGSDKPSISSSLSYNSLKIPATKEGKYEFKVFATDKRGNVMKHDGENITSDNVWDFDDIPYFTFEIENKGLKVEDPTTSKGRKDTEVLDETYTFEDPKIIGATDLQKAYALYKIDLDTYNNSGAPADVNETHLIGVTYEQIAGKVAEMNLATKENKFDAYLEAYANILAVRVGKGTTAKQLIDNGLFVKISEAGDRINGKEADDKYEWNADAKSFKTVEEGYFLVVADYWEEANPTYRASAYKVVLVESKNATIEGESQWWKNNLLSVILFSIAGVLLILVIILLFVKPSDEKLEDLDKKASKKQKKAKKEKKDEE